MTDIPKGEILTRLRQGTIAQSAKRLERKRLYISKQRAATASGVGRFHISAGGAELKFITKRHAWENLYD